MGLHRVSKLVLGLVLGGGTTFANPVGSVALVGDLVNLTLYPGPGSVNNTSSPASVSYSASGPAGASQYSTVTNAAANRTSVSVQTVMSESGPAGAGASEMQYTEALSNLFLEIGGPVYLSETLTLSHSSDVTGQFGGALGDAEVIFYTGNGDISSNECHLNTMDGDGSLKSCSTPLLFVNGSDSFINIWNKFSEQVSVDNPGVSVSVQGTATLGPLQVYDQNFHLIETIDLNSLQVAPEPSCFLLIALGLASILAAKSKISSTVGED
jgi:hypothetical protein